MRRIDAFRNLMVLAAADGKITEPELALLIQRSDEWDVSDAEIQSAIEYAQSPEAALALPIEPRECRAMLAEMMRLIAVDGELAEIEKQLFAMAAARMRISDSDLNQLLDEILR
jgi:uncharacterized tellurite resistance protein B-like protein